MPVWALHVQERATLNILKVGLIIYIYTCRFRKGCQYRKFKKLNILKISKSLS